MPAGHPYPYLIQSEKGGARDGAAFFYHKVAGVSVQVSAMRMLTPDARHLKPIGP